jgi:hypothetical protein
MRHGKFLALVLVLCGLSAAFGQTAAAPQDTARPRQDIPTQAAIKRAANKPARPSQAVSKQSANKKNSAPEPLAFDPASKMTFIIYDIGTLHMVGKSPADATYAIGTLRMTGRAGAATYLIGTLSMSGLREP